MADEQQPEFQFFVYIIESPSAPDLYHGRSEGGRVAETLRLDNIRCVTRTAINQEAFSAAITIGLPEAMKEIPDRYPILHLSAHGSEAGIELSSGEVINWAELRKLLLPLNASLDGALLLCMSACRGYNACQMAMEVEDGPHPYFVMVGSSGNPTWSDTAVSYLTFYHLLAKGKEISDAVAGMSAASGVDWVFETADESKQYFLEYIKNTAEPAVVQQQLQEASDLAPLTEGAKGLERGGDERR